MEQWTACRKESHPVLCRVQKGFWLKELWPSCQQFPQPIIKENPEILAEHILCSLWDVCIASITVHHTCSIHYGQQPVYTDSCRWCWCSLPMLASLGSLPQPQLPIALGQLFLSCWLHIMFLWNIQYKKAVLLDFYSVLQSNSRQHMWFCETD